MLAVVQHEEQFAACEVGHECVEQRFAGALAAPEHSGHGVWHQVGSLHRRQIDQPYAVWEGVGQAGGDAKRQLRLAASARPGEGHQAPRCLQYQIPNRGAVLLAPDQVRMRRWQVVVPCGRHVARSPSNSRRPGAAPDAPRSGSAFRGIDPRRHSAAAKWRMPSTTSRVPVSGPSRRRYSQARRT